MGKIFIVAALLVFASFVAACTTEVEVIKEVEVTREVQVIATPPPPAAAEPRELSVVVGTGRDTEAILAFFPQNLQIRVGDTVTWKIDTDEIHTVSFLEPDAPIPPFPAAIPGEDPGNFMLNPLVAFPTRLPGAEAETYGGTGFVSSGILQEQPPAPGAPPNDRVSITFSKPGTFKYLCLIHPGSMLGTVEVVAQGPAPSQAEIDSQAQKESAVLMARLDLARAQAEGTADGLLNFRIHSDVSADGNDTWFVKAGATEMVTADPNTQILEFFPQDITIQTGDTVVWGSDFFHSITFDPAPEPAHFVSPEPQEQGPPLLRLSPAAFGPAKPSAVFDAAYYYNSGDLGPFSNAGNTWALTFDKPGTFKYFCVFHREFGMEGTVTVTERIVERVASLNSGAAEFPEGLAVDRDGNIYAGMFPTGEIRMFTPQGESSTFAQLPKPGEGLMLGLEFGPGGDLYVAMSSFDSETHGIWKVSRDGSKVERFAILETEGFPNALTFDSKGNLYVSDTIGGGVWKIDPQGNVSTWKTDPLMMGNVPPGPVGFPVGANGVLLDTREKNLYVAVTEKARIVRIPINSDGSAGDVEVFAEDAKSLGGPDGMTWGPSGNIYVALVGSDAVAVVSPDGKVTTLASGGGLENPSDVKFGVGVDANTLYIANSAIFRVFGLQPGAPHPALMKMMVEAP